MIQERERIVLETLESIPKRNVVLIGGYAMNAYVPPRFSIDCDLVVLGDSSNAKATLRRSGFVKIASGDLPYGNYMCYFRENERVSFDLFMNSLLDRETGIIFEGELFKKYSLKRITVGRTNPVRIEMKIVDPELLFVMKFVTARRQDIRDAFMLAGEDLNWKLVSEIISMKCGDSLIRKRIDRIRNGIQSKNYRDSLQSAFGKIPDERFNFCKNRLVEFLSRSNPE